MDSGNNYIGFGTIKRRSTDILYTKYLRKLRDYTCEKCLRYFPEGTGLTVSHFWGRKAESVRFDDENCDCLCIGCHQRFEENPSEYTEWKKNRMAPQAFKALDVRAHTLEKRDDALTLLTIKSALKNL